MPRQGGMKMPRKSEKRLPRRKKKMLSEYEGYKKRVKIDKRCWDEEEDCGE